MIRGAFDVGAFHSALDSQRLAKGFSWKQVGEDAGVDSSIFTRMGQGKRPDVDSLALLLAWSGLDASAFLPGANQPEPLAQATAFLRADRNLDPEDAKALEEIIRVAYNRFSRGRSENG